jgi:hypothetical protein
MITSFTPSTRVFLAKVQLTIVSEKVVAGIKTYYQTMAPLAAFNLAST